MDCFITEKTLSNGLSPSLLSFQDRDCGGKELEKGLMAKHLQQPGTEEGIQVRHHQQTDSTASLCVLVTTRDVFMAGSFCLGVQVCWLLSALFQGNIVKFVDASQPSS